MATLHGQGIAACPGNTTDVFTTPYPIVVGSRARDGSGNEYVFVNFTGSTTVEQPVQISSDFTAAPVGIVGRGMVGVACAQYASSDNAGWVQIYGRCMMQISGLTSAGSQPSPSDDANGPTTLSTTLGTKFKLPTSLTSPAALAWTSGNVSTGSAIYVEGMTVATDASVSNSVSGTCNTTNSSVAHTGAHVAVFLNYPHLVHRNYGE